MARSLVHPRMLAALPQFYPHRVTIEAKATTRDAAGQPAPASDPAAWLPLAGHVGLAAVVGVKGGGERRGRDQVITQTTQRIAVQGYHPAITTAHRAAASDGHTYAITNVQHDSQQLATYLDVEIVS